MIMIMYKYDYNHIIKYSSSKNQKNHKSITINRLNKLWKQ